MSERKFQRFKALHEASKLFVLPNPWDAGSARILTNLGFDALATTSAGLAACLAKQDTGGGLDASIGLTRDDVIQNAADIVAATPLPVTADLEGGYGESPQACAQTIQAAIDVGLVGGSIEDASGDPQAPIFSMEAAVERIQAAAEAAAGKPFLLTARAENYLHDRPDLADTILRLQAFAEAGAHVLYAPGLIEIDDIRTLCAEVPLPVNVLVGIPSQRFTLQELEAAGARRASIGSGLARVAMSAFLRAAQALKGDGRLDYAHGIASHGEIAKLTTTLTA